MSNTLLQYPHYLESWNCLGMKVIVSCNIPSYITLCNKSGSISFAMKTGHPWSSKWHFTFYVAIWSLLSIKTHNFLWNMHWNFWKPIKKTKQTGAYVCKYKADFPWVCFWKILSWVSFLLWLMLFFNIFIYLFISLSLFPFPLFGICYSNVALKAAEVLW